MLIAHYLLMPATQLHNKIMRRIWTTYLLRLALSWPAVRYYVLFALMAVLLHFVSLLSVLKNVPWSVDPLFVAQYFQVAFLNTELIVQLTLVAIALVAGWMAVSSLAARVPSLLVRRAL